MAVEFRLLAGNLLRVGCLLHQFGDRVAQGVFGLLAPEQIAKAAEQGALVAAHARFQGLGTPMRCRMRDFGHFHAAGVAGMVVVLAAQVQRAMDDQMRQMVAGAAALARPPPPGPRPAPG